MYHGISSGPLPAGSHRVHVNQRAFKAQMGWLYEQGYRSVPLTDLLSDNKREKVFAITFDDGFKSQIEIAAPILSDYGFSATAFIATDWLSKKSKATFLAVDMLPSDAILNWNDARDLLKLDWDIASHTASHIDCSVASSCELLDELTRSKEAITAELGSAPQSFAFPFGKYNKAAIRQVKQLYPLAFSVHTGLSGIDKAYRHREHRIEINSYDTMQTFKQKILTGYANPSEKLRAKLRDQLYSSLTIKDTISLLAK